MKFQSFVNHFQDQYYWVDIISVICEPLSGAVVVGGYLLTFQSFVNHFQEQWYWVDISEHFSHL